MLTLLQINSVVNIGSTGRIVEDIGQMAILEGWKSYIAYGRYGNSSKSELIKIGSDWDIKLHGIQTRLFDRHGLGSRRATVNFVNLITKINPDIIHLHNLHGYYINIEVLFKFLAKKNIQVVWTFHDCWPLTGHCVHFDFIGCNKWKTGCYNCPQKKEYPTSNLFDRSKLNYCLKKNLFTSVKKITIVPVSEWLKNTIKQSFLNQHALHTINNGINTDVFRPIISNSIINKYNLKSKIIILGVASFWNKRKGLEDFIKLSRNLETNYQIILVGLNKFQIKALPTNIIGLEKTENIQELVTLYSVANVYVNLSVEETFGMTTVEALACGTPVIVYNSTASPELITTDTGFIVEKGNIQGIINAIKIIEEHGKCSYRIACCENAKKLYNKNDRYLDYINLYKSLLNL